MERVFDICHGCRRCVSLCQSFPTLFDLIDATADGEVHGVDKKDYAKVVDQCYLCDLCYMTKCPYVPPHPWNVDFPHLMLRAKAIKFRQGRGRRRREAARLDRRARPARRHPDRRAGGQRREPDEAGAQGARRRARRASRRLAAAARDASAFAAAREERRRAARSSTASAARARSRSSPPATSTTTSPASATTCSRCSTTTRFPTSSSRRRAAAACPSSSSATSKASRGYKDEEHSGAGALRARGLRDPLGDPVVHADVQAGAAADVSGRGRRRARCSAAMFDPFEYLDRAPSRRPAEDRLQAAARQGAAITCRATAGCRRSAARPRRCFKLIGKTVAVEINTVERCSGHAGTYGVKTPTHPVAMKIGRPVFKAMAAPAPDFISSDCALAGHHIAQGMARERLRRRRCAIRSACVRQAYGLDVADGHHPRRAC